MIGDLNDLRVPADVGSPSRAVSDAEVAEVSTELVAWMLRSMRDAAQTPEAQAPEAQTPDAQAASRP